MQSLARGEPGLCKSVGFGELLFVPDWCRPDGPILSPSPPNRLRGCSQLYDAATPQTIWGRGQGEGDFLARGPP